MATRYMLDTNICIYIAKNSPQTVSDRFELHDASELAMSVITLGELKFGAEKRQAREKAMAIIDRLVAAIEVMPVPSAASQHYGQIRASLQREGRPIGNNDLWLAAHARAEGWILVTNNEREFSRVEGLQIENWTQPPKDQ